MFCLVLPMNRKGISKKVTIITVIVVILILIALYFAYQNGSQEDVTGDGNSGDGLSTDLNNALTDTNSLDGDLNLDEDFDFGIE